MKSFEKVIGKKMKISVEGQRGGFNTEGTLVMVDDAGWMLIQKDNGKVMLVNISRLESIAEQ